MPIAEYKGDLLNTDCDVFIHCCNCFNRLGAGIAVVLAKRWPAVREADNATIRGDRKKLGTFSVAVVADRIIFNLYGQYRYGTDKRQVNYEALIRGLYAVREYLEDSGNIKDFKIGTYRLGCGLAGGNWNIVKPIIEEVFPDNTVRVYTL